MTQKPSPNEAAPRRPAAIKRRANLLRTQAKQRQIDLKQWQVLELMAAAHGAPSYQAYGAAPGQYTAALNGAAAARCAERAAELGLVIPLEVMEALLRPLVPRPARPARHLQVLGRLIFEPHADSPAVSESQPSVQSSALNPAARRGRALGPQAGPSGPATPVQRRPLVLANSAADARDIQRVARSVIELVRKHGGWLEVTVVRSVLAADRRWISMALKHSVLSGQLQRTGHTLRLPEGMAP